MIENLKSFTASSASCKKKGTGRGKGIREIGGWGKVKFCSFACTRLCVVGIIIIFIFWTNESLHLHGNGIPNEPYTPVILVALNSKRRD